MPFKYLGVPLDGKKLTIANCQPLIEKMMCRLNHRCTRLLSYAGRLQLAKSVLFAIANYWLQISPLPKKVISHIESLCRRFLWSGKEDVRKTAPVSWETICNPIAEGGLNVIGLGWWNQATLGKMLWNLYQKKDRLWIKWVHHFYMKGKNIIDYMPKTTASWIIRAIFKHNDVIMESDDWKEFDLTGMYRTNRIYRELKGPNPFIPWNNLVRGNWARPREIFILWLTCQRRLQTNDRLARFGTLTDGKCLYCDEFETCNHLFFECIVPNTLWQKVLDWLKLAHLPQNLGAGIAVVHH
ncbi:uncharacterized protein LOC131657781 [Vicia villosa]|uniref:uncharacterized protein LOC131657781 n=1 Tax=Vicia villosa TaxID=3911 RepID=UPI00273B535A|nr:uncharacterized protein LOC131657781 [Vicia villosa]